MVSTVSGSLPSLNSPLAAISVFFLFPKQNYWKKTLQVFGLGRSLAVTRC